MRRVVLPLIWVMSLLMSGLAVVTVTAPAAVADGEPSGPEQVQAAAQPLGIEVSWQAPSAGPLPTGYRVWLVGEELATSQVLAADVRKWFVGTPDSSAHSIAVVAINDAGESGAVVTGAVNALSPGGVTEVARQPVGFASISLAAGVTKSLTVADRKGIPSALKGVWLTVKATSARATTLSVWSAGARPTTPQISFARSTTVVQSVFVALNGTGRVQLRTGANGLRVKPWVAAWVRPTSASAGRVGTLTPVTPSRVSDAVMAAGSSTSVPASDAVGVPTSGVSAVLASLSVRGKAPTVVSASVTNSAPASPSAAGVSGHRVTNQVLLAVDSRGRFRLSNGAAPARVSVDILGWLSSEDAVTGVDTPSGLWTIVGAPQALSQPQTVLSTGQRMTVPVAGSAGVPAFDTQQPPAAVLIELAAIAKGGDVMLGLSAAQVDPVYPGTVAVRPGAPAASSVWVPLSTSGSLTVSNLSTGTGQAKIHMRVLGYGVGAVLVNPDLDVVKGSTAAGYGPLDLASGLLTLASGIEPPKIGTIVASGPTLANPAGLLVRVLGIDPGPDGSSILHIRSSSLVEAIRRGAVQAALTFDPVTSNAAAQTTAESRADFVADTSYTISESFERKYGGDTATATISGSATATAAGSVNVDIGWRGISGRAAVDLDEQIKGTFAARAATSWSETVPLGSYDFRWFVFTIGPVPVVVRPGVQLDLLTNGEIQGEVQVDVAQSAHATLGLELDGNLDVINDFTSTEPSLAVTKAQASLHANMSLRPQLTLDFYGVGGLSAGLTLAVNADWTYPDCEVVFTGTIDGTLGAALDVFGPNIHKEWSQQLASSELGRLPLPLLSSQCSPRQYRIIGGEIHYDGSFDAACDYPEGGCVDTGGGYRRLHRLMHLGTDATFGVQAAGEAVTTSTPGRLSAPLDIATWSNAYSFVETTQTPYDCTYSRTETDSPVVNPATSPSIYNAVVELTPGAGVNDFTLALVPEEGTEPRFGWMYPIGMRWSDSSSYGTIETTYGGSSTSPACQPGSAVGSGSIIDRNPFTFHPFIPHSPFSDPPTYDPPVCQDTTCVVRVHGHDGLTIPTPAGGDTVTGQLDIAWWYDVEIGPATP